MRRASVTQKGQQACVTPVVLGSLQAPSQSILLCPLVLAFISGAFLVGWLLLA